MLKKLFILFYLFVCFFSKKIVAEEIDRKIGTKKTEIINIKNNSTNQIDKKDNPIKEENTNSVNFFISEKERRVLPYFKKYPSIMILDKNIVEIDDVINNKYIFVEKKDNVDVEKEKVGVFEIVSETNLNVYLNSIMFVSTKEWAIWLNGQKITNLDNGESEIVVVNLNSQKAIFEWEMGLSKWSIVNVNNLIPERSYKMNEDNSRVTLTFALNPNQTFIPSLNRIIDGKLKIEENKEETATKSTIEDVIIESIGDNFYF